MAYVEQIGRDQIGRMQNPAAYPIVKMNQYEVVAQEEAPLFGCFRVTITIDRKAEQLLWLEEPSIKRSRIARTPTRRLENTLSRTLLAGSGFVDEYSGDVFFGEWNDDAYGVLADGVMVGRIFNAAASPVGTPWMWTLAFGHHEDRIPTHGYEPTREAAMTAFAKSWRRD